nr:hypothetical protein [Tanacetum cinerariifolium]
MSSYEVIVNGYYGMPMDPLDPYIQLVMEVPPPPDYIPGPEAPPSPDYIPGPEAPPSPDYIPGPEAPPSPDYIPGPEYPEYLPPADDVLPAEEQPLPAVVSPTAELPGYIMESEPEMEPEEEDGDNEKSEEDSIEYPTSGRDDDADDDGDDLSEDDADDEDDEEESSDISPTSYPLPPFFMPLPIFTPLHTSSFPLPSSLPSTSGSESIPEADIPLQKRARFTTPTGRYEVGESSVAATARQIRPALAIADRRRDDDRLIGRLRREAKMEPKRTTRSTQVPPVTPTSTATTTTVTEAQLQALINQGVVDAMAEAEASRVRNGYSSNGSGPRLAQTIRKCTYPNFLKCQPLNFKGTERVIGLTRWFEKIESVFNISICIAAFQVKYAVYTLQGVALTWWNSHVKTVTLEVAQALPWKTLKKMMTDKYCPKGEIKKLKTKMWELKTKGTDVIGYSCRFQELALMCNRTFLEESDRVEKYIGGVPDMIHDSVKATKPKTMLEAIEFATELMDKMIRDVVENKRKFEGTSGNNQNQPQQNKRQNTG